MNPLFSIICTSINLKVAVLILIFESVYYHQIQKLQRFPLKKNLIKVLFSVDN